MYMFESGNDIMSIAFMEEQMSKTEHIQRLDILDLKQASDN